jgi:hypothetical protein
MFVLAAIAAVVQIASGVEGKAPKAFSKNATFETWKPVIDTLMSAARDQFRSIATEIDYAKTVSPGGRAYKVSLVLPGASNCSVENGSNGIWTYECELTRCCQFNELVPTQAKYAELLHKILGVEGRISNSEIDQPESSSFVSRSISFEVPKVEGDGRATVMLSQLRLSTNTKARLKFQLHFTPKIITSTQSSEGMPSGRLTETNPALDTQRQTVRTAMSESAIREEISRIRTSGTYSPLPKSERAASQRIGTILTVKNSTPYVLTVYFDGPVTAGAKLEPGSSQAITLASGRFQVAGRVSAGNVAPFFGEETYSGSVQMTFYIE